MMSIEGFNLTKWLSTNKKILDTLLGHRQGKKVKEIFLGGSGLNFMLGINWLLAKDTFYFTVEIPAKSLTKHMLLSITNFLYDPFGFLAPDVRKARLLYKGVCQENHDWDESISSSLRKQSKCWCNSLND